MVANRLARSQTMIWPAERAVARAARADGSGLSGMSVITLMA